MSCFIRKLIIIYSYGHSTCYNLGQKELEHLVSTFTDQPDCSSLFRTALSKRRLIMFVSEMGLS